MLDEIFLCDFLENYLLFRLGLNDIELVPIFTCYIEVAHVDEGNFWLLRNNLLFRRNKRSRLKWLNSFFRIKSLSEGGREVEFHFWVIGVVEHCL